MSITLKAHTVVNGAGGGTTPPIDTTGATLLVCSVASAGSGTTVSDSMGNVWIPLSTIGTGLDIKNLCVINPVVGLEHTFTVVGVAVCMCIAAFDGIDSVDKSAVGGESESQLGVNPGEIIPSVAGELFVTSYGTDEIGQNQVDSGFIITDSQQFVGGTSFGSAMAYKISGISGENPLWTNTGAGVTEVAVMTAFFPTVSVPGGPGRGPIVSPILLANGWLAGTPVPLTCNVGISPDFYDIASRTLYSCIDGQYVISAPPANPGTIKREIFLNLPVFASNAAAKAAGLVDGNPYRTPGDPSTVCVVS